MSKRFAEFVKRFRTQDLELIARVGQLPCRACGRNPGSDAHHLKTKKSGGPDEAWNLIPLCREHHQMIHAQGISFMAHKFPDVEKFLIQYGWEKCLTRAKWIKAVYE